MFHDDEDGVDCYGFGLLVLCAIAVFIALVMFVLAVLEAILWTS